jgi:carbamoyltransferase
LQLLNSSFNVKAEPIVCKLIDALNSFLKNKINYLVMGNYLIKKIK